MRAPIETQIDTLAGPPIAARQEAARGGGQAAHDAFLAAWPCLNAVEVAPPPTPAPLPEAFTVVAWNLERCKWVAETADRLSDLAADVILATEMDHGMARSGQHHTTRALAEALGFGYAYGVEFVELALGDPAETAAAAGSSNRHGLHGNAILSRWPLSRVAVLPLDDGGGWFGETPKGDTQLRVGGRMAVAARLATARGPVTLAAAHYESNSTAESRSAETERLLAQIHTLYGRGAAVIGGDLNTACCAEPLPADLLTAPARLEPSFAVFEDAGFRWQEANTGRTTTRKNPARPSDRPHRVLDWLLVRRAAAEDPFLAEALSRDGAYLSDHEAVGVTIRM